MKAIITILVVVSFFSSEAQEKAETAPLVLSQIQVVPIQDSQFDRQYELYIELPEGYSENPDKRYSVLYYTDAVWHREILSGCAEFILTDAILVGISWQKDIDQELIDEHGIHVSRYRDYTVKKSADAGRQARYAFGNAASHLTFIKDDVIPFVEANYRARPEDRSYFGYSAGGLFGASVLLSQPETFKNYILGSPSVDGDIPILEQIGSTLNQEINASVFISYGTEEEELAGFGDQFIAMLKARNEKNLIIDYARIEGTHQTAFPMTGVKGMTWLLNRLEM